MFSRDFARGPTWPVHPTVDLALYFHKKIPLYVPSSLNISKGGSLLAFCTMVGGQKRQNVVTECTLAQKSATVPLVTHSPDTAVIK